MGKKIIFIALLFFVYGYLIAQTIITYRDEKQQFCEKQIFKKQSIYIAVRGTASKQFIIADEFNIADTNSTHVGIGYNEKGKSLIINVTNDASRKNNALVIEPLNKFIESDEVVSCSIYRLKVSNAEYRKFKAIIKKIQPKKIVFDFQFNLFNEDTLYCSELCYQILSQIDSGIIRTPFIRRKITNPFIKTAINREYLDYIPVDFYYYINRRLEHIETRFFKKNICL